MVCSNYKSVISLFFLLFYSDFSIHGGYDITQTDSIVDIFRLGKSLSVFLSNTHLPGILSYRIIHGHHTIFVIDVLRYQTVFIHIWKVCE